MTNVLVLGISLPLLCLMTLTEEQIRTQSHVPTEALESQLKFYQDSIKEWQRDKTANIKDAKKEITKLKIILKNRINQSNQ